METSPYHIYPVGPLDGRYAGVGTGQLEKIMSPFKICNVKHRHRISVDLEEPLLGPEKAA